jgi:hypothetical protein
MLIRRPKEAVSMPKKRKRVLLAVTVIAALAVFGVGGAAIALASGSPATTQVDQPQIQAPAGDVTEADQAGEAEEAGDTDAVECDNGIDPTTGAECDGGPAANSEDAQG